MRYFPIGKVCKEDRKGWNDKRWLEGDYLDLELREGLSKKVTLVWDQNDKKVIAMQMSEKEYFRQREQQMQMS